MLYNKLTIVSTSSIKMHLQNVKIKFEHVPKQPWESNFSGLFDFQLIISGRRNLVFQCPEQAAIKKGKKRSTSISYWCWLPKLSHPDVKASRLCIYEKVESKAQSRHRTKFKTLVLSAFYHGKRT